MTLEQCKLFLAKLDTGRPESTGTLRHLAYVVGKNGYGKIDTGNRTQLINMLSRFYCDTGRIGQIWELLNDAEHRMLSLHIWSDGSSHVSLADEVAEQYGVGVSSIKRYYYYSKYGLDRYREKYSDKDSLLWLLFPNDVSFRPFYDELHGYTGDLTRDYSEVTGVGDIFSRENRAADYTRIVRFCNSNTPKANKNTPISKVAALKLWKHCGYEEHTTGWDDEPEHAKTIQELLVTYPLCVLCMTGGLLYRHDDKLLANKKAVDLLIKPYEQLVKTLFNAYLDSKKVNESLMIQGIKVAQYHHPCEARKNLVEELKNCPAGRLIHASEFDNYLRISDPAFARDHVYEVIETYYGYTARWSYYESPLISIILTYFGVLGLLDLVWGQDENERRIPFAFRINPLGEYVLGMTDSYTAAGNSAGKEHGGFTVLPDYTIVIPESADRIRHEMYFENLYTSVSTTDQATIYKLDFATVVRAIDKGIGVSDLRTRLLDSDKPLPDNIERALNDWEKQAERIRIRKVTILECDDIELLEEVIRYRGMGEWVQETIRSAAVIDAGAANAVKKIVEKNKRFCINASK